MRERLLPDEELDVLDGPRVAMRANHKAPDERMPDPDLREVLGGNPHRIEDARSNDPVEQCEVRENVGHGGFFRAICRLMVSRPMIALPGTTDASRSVRRAAVAAVVRSACPTPRRSAAVHPAERNEAGWTVRCNGLLGR